MGIGRAFSGFIRNGSGRLTHTTTHRITSGPNNTCGPLFLCNNANLNGARLLRTINGNVVTHGPGTGIICVRSRHFIRSVIGTLRGGTVRRFGHCCHSMSTLLVSSVRFFTGGRQSRRRFFRAFGTLLRNGRRVVLASSHCPGRVGNIRSHLGSHFN